MKILVVGGAGYIGGAVTDLLKLAKHEFRVYDNLMYEDTYRKKCTFIKGDIREHEKLKKQLDWADTVIWLAAIVGDGACQINPAISKEVNEKPVKWLVDNFNGRILFTSTCSVYGASEELLDESSSTNPLSVYAATKLKAEEYLKNKDAIIFRLGTVYGVSDTYSRIRFDLVLNIMAMRAFKDSKLTVFGGDQFRPLVHVKDVARAMVHSLVNGTRSGIYNLSNRNIKISDLAFIVSNHFENVTVETTEMMFEDSRNYKVTSEKFFKEFGFTYRYSINDGIQDIESLLSEGRLNNIEDIRYSNQAFLEENKEKINV